MQDYSPSASVENAIALQKFGVGQPVLRKEDDTLVRGKGKYTDDFNLPGQAYAWIVRSSHAHGIIKGIDTSAAKAMPGVLGVWTGTDLAPAGYGPYTCGLPLKNRDGTPLLQTNRTALMSDKVRYVGDPVAFVVAETLAQARDAAEAVALDIEPLPAVTSAEEAAKPGAPLLYDHIPNNVALDYHYGDTAKVEAAFTSAAHVTKLDITNTRVAVVAMEPRAALASYDRKSERYTIQVPTQGVAGNRTNLAKNLLKVPNDKVHLLTANVGGSFGMKNINYPEYMCILHATKSLGRPVKWTDERSTSFLSDSHGRAQQIHAELALDAEGKFLAVKVSGYGNLGAYITGVAPSPLSLNVGKNIASVYRTPLLSVDIKTVLTNTTLMGAYRGAGRPEANYFMERLIDRAADEMGINRLTLRKRNFIKPAQMPFPACSGVTYDSGDFHGVFNKALEISDHASFAKRKKESRKRGKLRGIAVGSYLEVTAPPGVELGKIVFEDDAVKLITGTLDYGQGHATPFAQVMSDQLGVPFEAVKLVQGDSDIVHTGNGTGGSRSITASGMAIVEASKLVIEKGKKAAAHLMEAAEGDIEFAKGRFTIAGTDRSIDIMELSRRLREDKMPEGVPSSLDVDHTTKEVPSTFPNGCHVAEVEIDPDTGVVQIVRYTGVNDFGTIVNPMLVAGQLHGGVAQGIGQALMECVSYDSSGQPITGSFMDYAMPRAEDIPMMAVGDHPVPAKSNPLGTKGCGEAGCAGSLSTIVNAVIDALAEFGISHIDMPLTSERIWRAIQDAKAKVA
jgi:carbon-monoxide dehydrogenase large subunit